jgi:hypothetical protein
LHDAPDEGGIRWQIHQKPIAKGWKLFYDNGELPTSRGYGEYADGGCHCEQSDR